MRRPAHPSPPPLAYARADVRPARVSRLAAGSLFVVVVASPCTMSQVFPGRDATPYLVASAAVSVAVPILALIRIHRSRGTRTGTAWAACALAIAVIGWGLIFVMLGAMGSYWHG